MALQMLSVVPMNTNGTWPSSRGMLGCGSLSPSICNAQQGITKFTAVAAGTNFDYFDPHDAALIDNLLNQPTVFTDRLADQTARHLHRLLAVLEHQARLAHRLARLAKDLERARVLLQLDVGHAVQFARRLDVNAVRPNRQPHQVFFDAELVRVAAQIGYLFWLVGNSEIIIKRKKLRYKPKEKTYPMSNDLSQKSKKTHELKK